MVSTTAPTHSASSQLKIQYSIFKVIKQGSHGAGVALKPWRSVPTNQNLSQNQFTQI